MELYIFWRVRVYWPHIFLCRPFCIFDRCQDSNPDCCRRKHSNLATHLPSSQSVPSQVVRHAFCNFYQSRSCPPPPSPLAAIGKGAEKGLSSSLWLLSGEDSGEYYCSRLLFVLKHMNGSIKLCVLSFFGKIHQMFFVQFQLFRWKRFFTKCCATYFANSFFSPKINILQ